ncbi:MAG TPA: pro-sigmaK processing inhibitor BofA [Firmicutes bacterium]|jgi:inhibitor of the pro-sigma K processing machinery|nr:pro-sigmaK processing inhibitor BofA [Bacillota bacterium]
MINFDLNFMIALFFGILVLYILARLLYLPMRIIMRFLGNTVMGAIMLALFNLAGAYWGLQIGINVITAVIIGFLGIPGIIMLLILQRVTML